MRPDTRRTKPCAAAGAALLESRLGQGVRWGGQPVIGELLGRFRLVAEAARTDSAVLYRARDDVSGAPAGVTVLGPDAIATLGDIRAFQRRVLMLHGMRS